jgi:hypothetical protein
MKKILFVLVLVLLIKCASRGEIKVLSVEATGTSRDYQLAIDKAKQDARVELAQELNAYVEGLIKKFDEEVGLTEDSELLGLYAKTSKIVVDQSVVGSHITKKDVNQEGELYKAYIVMEAPLGQAREKLLEEIRASEPLYQRFLNSASFKELEEEIRKEKK